MQKMDNISPQELWFLFSQHAPATIIGFSDPTTGFLMDEIEKMTIQAQESLLERNIIKLGHPNQLVVREPFLSLTQSVVNPLHTILVARQDIDTNEVLRSYHFTASQILELSEQETNMYCIREAKNIQEICDFFLEPLAASIYSERDESTTVLSEKNLTTAYAHIEKKQIEKVPRLLNSSFKTSGQLERFIEALSKPIIRLSLVAFQNRSRTNMSKTQGFSALVSDQDIWLFMPENESYDFVQIRSISKIELEHTIHAYLPKLEATL